MSFVMSIISCGYQVRLVWLVFVYLSSWHHVWVSENPESMWEPQLFSDTYLTVKDVTLPTYWPAIHWPSDWLRGSRLIASWWWCENCIVFSDRTHSAPSLIISWCFALQNWATRSYIASCARQWRTILSLLFPSRAPQWGKKVYKLITNIQL